MRVILLPMSSVEGHSSLSQEQEGLPVGHAHGDEPGHAGQEQEQGIASVVKKFAQSGAASSPTCLLAVNVVQSLVEPQVESDNEEEPARRRSRASRHLWAEVLCGHEVADQ